MRTLSCLAAILLLAGAVMAADTPIDKGSMIVDGSVYFGSQGGDLYKDTADNSITTIGIMPSVGYFVAPSIMVGGQIVYVSSSQGDDKMTTFSVGPVVGYYFNLDATRTEVKGAIYPYVKGFFLYGQNKLEWTGSDATTDVMSFGGQGGAVFMLSNAIGLNASVRFQSDSFKPEGADESTTGTSLQVGAGITAFLW